MSDETEDRVSSGMDDAGTVEFQLTDAGFVIHCKRCGWTGNPIPTIGADAPVCLPCLAIGRVR